jgi:hypothetical protein
MGFGKHPQQLKELPEGELARGDDIVFGEPGVPTTAAEALCGFPVGNGTCVMPPNHAGNHRLTLPEPEATAP